MINPPRLYKELTALRHVRRFARTPCVFPINVAEHSYLVAMLATGYAAQMRETFQIPVDIGRIALGALWHDAPEALTSDIPHDVKRYNLKILAEVNVMEEHARLELLAQAGLEHATDLHPDPIEEFVIKVADCVELLCYAHTESRVGNPALGVPAARIWTLLNNTMRLKAEKQQVLKWYEHVLVQLRHSTIEPFQEGASWPRPRV